MRRIHHADFWKITQDKSAAGGEGRSLGWAFLSALGTLLLNHLQLRLCRVHLRFRARQTSLCGMLRCGLRICCGVIRCCAIMSLPFACMGARSQLQVPRVTEKSAVLQPVQDQAPWSRKGCYKEPRVLANTRLGQQFRALRLRGRLLVLHDATLPNR